MSVGCEYVHPVCRIYPETYHAPHVLNADYRVLRVEHRNRPVIAKNTAHGAPGAAHVILKTAYYHVSRL